MRIITIYQSFLDYQKRRNGATFCNFAASLFSQRRGLVKQKKFWLLHAVTPMMARKHFSSVLEHLSSNFEASFEIGIVLNLRSGCPVMSGGWFP